MQLIKDRQRVCLIKKKSRRDFLLYLRGQPSKMNIKVRLSVKDYNLAKSLHIEVPQLPVDLIISIKKD